MKICILTQPLKCNYGGILQAYALQKTLKDMGHDVLTLNYDRKIRLSKKTIIKRIVARLLWGKRISIFGNVAFPEINKKLIQFVNENINYSEIIYAPLKYEHIAKYKFDAYIVGSDQVWRSAYSPYLPTFFLDFLKYKGNAKKIAYAASFGTPSFDANLDDLDLYASLAQKFDAISVREKDAINIVENNLKSRAELVLDPTMLLDAHDYTILINKYKEHDSKNENIIGKQCFGYILDVNRNKMAIYKSISSRLNLVHNLLTIQQFPPKNFNLDTCIQPSVTSWLRMIKNSSFVVTDSFHGTVFSIIFNKPFVVIANMERGVSRFNTLLEIFDFSYRIISPDDPDALEKILSSKIDWDKVNEILNQYRKRSNDFLNFALK